MNGCTTIPVKNGNCYNQNTSRNDFFKTENLTQTPALSKDSDFDFSHNFNTKSRPSTHRNRVDVINPSDVVIGRDTPPFHCLHRWAVQVVTTACFIITSSLPLSNSSDRERQQAIHVSDPSRPPIQNPRPFLSGSIRISSNSSRLAAIDFHRCALLGHVVRVVKNCALNFFFGGLQTRPRRPSTSSRCFLRGRWHTYTHVANKFLHHRRRRSYDHATSRNRPTGEGEICKSDRWCMCELWLLVCVCTLNKKSLYFCFFSRAAPLFFKRPIAKTPILHIIVGVTIGFDWLFLAATLKEILEGAIRVLAFEAKVTLT